MLDFIFSRTPFFYLIQSIWRDEAFSYFMAKPNIIQIILNTAHDFNPPLYYLILHFWINLFGRSDEMLRLLSFLFFVAGVYIAYLLALKMFSKKFALFVAFFTLLNPMLLYYAFEIRMYSLFAFLTFASLYFFYIKDWKKYLIFSVLGLYTHSFFPLILASFFLFLLVNKKNNKRQTFFLTLKPFLFYLPWLPILLTQFFRSKDSWLFPVDLQLVKSVLGNIFTNYEGTPGQWWPYTALLSLFILFFFFLAFRRKRKDSLLFLIPVFLPLSLILGYSFLKRPLYVNRYLIFITVFEIMGLSLGIWSIKNKMIRKAVAFGWLLLIIVFNFKIIPARKKTDFKRAFMEINHQAKPEDFVYTQTPISFLESAYYYRYQNKVFLYNPKNITVPNYIGVTVVFPAVSKVSLPPAPSKTFSIADDASYEILLNR